MNHWIEDKVENEDNGQTLFTIYRQPITSNEPILVGRFAVQMSDASDTDCLFAWRNQRATTIFLGGDFENEGDSNG